MQGNLQDSNLQLPTSKWLPPGFRFHPTDEELITYYLARKIADESFSDEAITELDLNKHEPWELPGKAQMMGEKEWYFFSIKDRKYPSGSRTNRATRAGYWKATGKDREVFMKSNKTNTSKHHHLVGMKKTLVFYEGRAPKGLKSNWVMHEYRMHSHAHMVFTNMHHESKFKDIQEQAWILCRVFHKKKLRMRRHCLESEKLAHCTKDDNASKMFLLEASDTITNKSNTTSDCDWLPPLCNDLQEEGEHSMVSTASRNSRTKISNLMETLPDRVLETPNVVKATSTTCISICNSSPQFSLSNSCNSSPLNPILGYELDNNLKSGACAPYTLLPRFPSDLESFWMHASSFLA